MKRILSADWTGKKTMWLSFHKMSLEANIHYNNLLKLKASLELKGYIKDLGQHHSGSINQVHEYSFEGFLRALDHAIKCDPNSDFGREYAKAKKHPITMGEFFVHADGAKKNKPFTPYLQFTTPKEVNEYENAQGCIPGWHGGGLGIPQKAKRALRKATCSECGKVFNTASPNPYTRCPTCRKVFKRDSLKSLVTK
jgi:hypothetical protein